MTTASRLAGLVLLLLMAGGRLWAAQEMTWAESRAKMRPYKGTPVVGIDTSTLTGKVVAGYQGWFNTPGDGSSLGWKHHEFRGQFAPGYCCIDMWPEVGEFAAADRADTPFRRAGGSPAQVFSSRNPRVVDAHFRWMKEAGIDGAFVQRFSNSATRRAAWFENYNEVLSQVREAANRHGRGYLVMYDLTNHPKDGLEKLKQDWRDLVDRMKIGRDSNDRAYFYHRGKPLVAVWGVGFNAKPEDPSAREFDLTAQIELVRWLQNDPKYGGCAVMVGTPFYWRTGQRDALDDPRLQKFYATVDIISPWAPGRYKSLEEITTVAEAVWKGDVAWCREQEVDYLPVVYPGFSWSNKKPGEQFDKVPRLQGKFLWKQYQTLAALGVGMVYQAMFDEMDEGTAIFKVTNDPPVGPNRFVTYEGLPADFYLRLVGYGGKLIRKEIASTEAIPFKP